MAREEAQAANAAVRAAQEAQEAASAYRVQAAHALEKPPHRIARGRRRRIGSRAKIGALTAEAEAHERRAVDLAEQLQRIADDRAREGSLADDAAEAIARLDREGEELGEQHASAEARLPELTQAIATSAATLRDAEVELARLRADLAGQAADRRIAEASAASARDALAQIESERDAVAARIAALGDEAALIDAEQDASAHVTAATATAETAESRSPTRRPGSTRRSPARPRPNRRSPPRALRWRRPKANTAHSPLRSPRPATRRARSTGSPLPRAMNMRSPPRSATISTPVGGASGWLGATSSASESRPPRAEPAARRPCRCTSRAGAAPRAGCGRP